MRVLIFLAFMAAGAGLWAENLPEWLIPLREAIYEQQLKADDVKPLYLAAGAAARRHYSGAVLDLALSRCEYFMGKVLQYDKRNGEAAEHFAEGMKFAEKAIAQVPSDDAWLMLSDNLSQSCTVRSTAFTMTNGLNVEKYAKNALELNGRNATAQYIVAARWVFAPAPFHNHKKGIQMMEAILTEGDMEKDNYFNVYSAIGYAYIQQKKYAEARPWLLKSLEIYPTNKFVAELLEKK
ncbi:MAG: tetratricopeptide repeat protein [Treponema sp.]|nr:tetratricopeptide repeat protein [Treponema sp.]